MNVIPQEIERDIVEEKACFHHWTFVICANLLHHHHHCHYQSVGVDSDIMVEGGEKATLQRLTQPLPAPPWI